MKLFASTQTVCRAVTSAMRTNTSDRHRLRPLRPRQVPEISPVRPPAGLTRPPGRRIRVRPARPVVPPTVATRYEAGREPRRQLPVQFDLKSEGTGARSSETSDLESFAPTTELNGPVATRIAVVAVGGIRFAESRRAKGSTRLATGSVIVAAQGLAGRLDTTSNG